MMLVYHTLASALLAGTVVIHDHSHAYCVRRSAVFPQ